MYPIYHFLFTLVISPFLYPILGWKLALFWLGGFFVDADHYIWEVLKNKDLSFKKAYDFCVKKSNGLVNSFDFHVFHVVEFWILIGIWGYLSEYGFIIFSGLVYHMTLDMVYEIIFKKYEGRPISIIEWMLCSKFN